MLCHREIPKKGEILKVKGSHERHTIVASISTYLFFFGGPLKSMRVGKTKINNILLGLMKTVWFEYYLNTEKSFILCSFIMPVLRSIVQ